MPYRRSHQKSRHGCLTCKKRRVKCDEVGPPCGNCRARATNCQYPTPEPTVQTSPTNSIVTASTVTSGSAISSQDPHFPEGRHTLELQLMHRWSVVTFRSLISHLIKDNDLWQLVIPNMAFTNSFLLNGLLAFSAFDIGSTNGPTSTQYIDAAFEYQSAAIKGFQTQLYNVNDENREALFYFSTLLMALSIVSVQFQPANGEEHKMIQNTATHFELVRGSGVILMKNMHIIDSNPLMRELKALEELDKVPLDPTVQSHIDELNRLNDDRYKRTDPLSNGDRVRSMQYKVACEQAIFWLRECFERCTAPDYRCYAMIWPSLSGEEYIKAIKEKDKVALLVLMYWGILADSLGQDYWWAKDFGRLLVHEIASIVSVNANGTVLELVLFAQQQVHVDGQEDIQCLQ